MGGWCRSSYPAGGPRLGCRSFDKNNDYKAIANSEAGDNWDNHNNSYLPPNPDKSRFSHGTTNIVIDNVYSENSSMFFYCRISPQNTPHTFILIRNIESYYTIHDGINVHGGVNHMYLDSPFVHYPKNVEDGGNNYGDDGFANGSSIGWKAPLGEKAPNNNKNNYPISAYVSADDNFKPVLTDSGDPSDDIECLDMRTTAQRALEWPDLLNTNENQKPVTEKYYLTHPYAMLAIAWNLNYKNPRACGVNGNSAAITWYGGAQISVRGLQCTSAASKCTQEQGDGHRCFDQDGSNTYCGGRIIADKYGYENIIENDGNNVL